MGGGGPTCYHRCGACCAKQYSTTLTPPSKKVSLPGHCCVAQGPDLVLPNRLFTTCSSTRPTSVAKPSVQSATCNNWPEEQ